MAKNSKEMFPHLIQHTNFVLALYSRSIPGQIGFAMLLKEFLLSLRGKSGSINIRNVKNPSFLQIT